MHFQVVLALFLFVFFHHQTAAVSQRQCITWLIRREGFLLEKIHRRTVWRKSMFSLASRLKMRLLERKVPLHRVLKKSKSSLCTAEKNLICHWISCESHQALCSRAPRCLPPASLTAPSCTSSKWSCSLPVRGPRWTWMIVVRKYGRIIMSLYQRI